MNRPAKTLDDREVIDALNAGDLRARVCTMFAHHSAMIDQLARQKTPIIQLRRLELATAEQLIALIQSDPMEAPTEPK